MKMVIRQGRRIIYATKREIDALRDARDVMIALDHCRVPQANLVAQYLEACVSLLTHGGTIDESTIAPQPLSEEEESTEVPVVEVVGE